VSSDRESSPPFEGDFALFDRVPQLGWIADAGGRAVHFNRPWCEYTGTPREQALECDWTAALEPSTATAVSDAWAEAVASGASFSMALALRRRDGVFRWFMTVAVPHHDEAGRVVRWLGTHTDIDDQKRRETALENAVKRREDLVAIVSHDLRNPLSTVLMGAKQIEVFADDSVLGARNKKAAQAVIRAVHQMTRLVGDLLDLARLEADQPLRLELDEVDVVELALRAVDASAPLAKARKQNLETRLTEGSVHAVCDGDRVLQVLGNLIGNAIKFTPEGGLIVVTVRKEASEIGEIVLSVSDTGPGIREDEVPRIFEPYWQADGPRRRGAGLGLSIVKAIVEAHRGRVWAETALGAGSTFHFTLPGIGAMSVPENKDE
jgi:PAS domain S-box-containing protein